MEIARAHEPIAIVGMGCRFPGGVASPDAFWKLLCGGGDAITEIPQDRLDLKEHFDPDPSAAGKIYTRWGGFLENVDAFDADFFGIAPREARRMDPQQRILLEVVWEALEDGGLPPDLLAGTKTGVFVGISSHDYTDIQDLPHNRHRIDAHMNAGGAMCIAANRISYLLDLRGPSLAVDTACSSSLTAVHLACRSLASRECDVAIVGGVNVLLAPEPTIGFCRATMLSPDGRCHTFDARANGYVRGEGAGAVVLKALSRAEADRDPIIAVIRGSAINQDGRTPGMSLPSADGQAEMLRQALRAAGVAPADVHYVEAHGTGTRAGDPVEAIAIGRVFSAGRPVGERCVIGSVKTNIGHLEAGAGIAGLIKTALVLSRAQIPPSLNFSDPNPAIPFEALRLRVPTTLESWPDSARPAVAGVNSFGFGGANAHVVLAEAPTRKMQHGSAARDRTHILALSARTPAALRELAARHAADVMPHDASTLEDRCYTAGVRRSHHEHRIAAVATDRQELSALLLGYVNGDEPPGLVAGRAARNRIPKLAFVFTGMGPQWWKMGRQLLHEEPVFRDTIEEVDALLRAIAGWSLIEELTAEESTSCITATRIVHVANFALQLGISALLRSWGVVPDVVAGHSSGEMAAACVAGVLSLEDGIRLAFHRSRLQDRTAGSGRMLAVGVPAAEAARLLVGQETDVSIAAINGPASTTLSGDADALERIASGLAQREVFFRYLPVEVPYHGPQMDRIRDELLAELSSLNPRPPSIPMVSSVTGDHVEGPDLGASYWWRNVREPVHFAAAMDRIAGDDCDVFVEVGPHPVLSAAITECLADRGRAATVLATLRREEDERRTMLVTLANLHVQGRRVNWSGIYPTGNCVPLPAYPWQRERHWFEINAAAEPPLPHTPGVQGEHVLLARRLRSPQAIWETELGGPGLAFLEEHQVEESVVFPGAGYVEMALSAAHEVWGDVPVTAERLAFRRLLVLPDRRSTLLQLHLDPDRRTVAIHALATKDAPSWTLHASGTVGPIEDARATADLNLETLRSRCVSRVDPAELYEAFGHAGLRYGRSFQGIRSLQQGEGEAVGWIELAEWDAATTEAYHVHPALLDAAFQVLGSILLHRAGRREGPFVPVSIARVEWFGRPGRGCWSHAVLTRDERDGVEGEVQLFDDRGRALLRCRGVRLRPLAAASPDGDAEAYFYQLAWDEAPLPPADGPARPVLPPPSGLARAIRLEPESLENDAALGRHYDVVEPALHRIAMHYARTALRQLGWRRESVDRDAGAVADALGVVPEHRKILRRLIEIVLADAEEDGPDDFDPTHLAADVVRHHPDQSAEFELLTRCGSRLADVLRGTVDPRDLLFSDSFAALARLYRTSPISRYYNEIAADVLARVARDTDGSRPLRVLEIGAGTCGLTSTVVRRLEPGNADYLFTDLSTWFLSRAREEFADRPEVRYGVFDLEVDPVAQHLAPGSFDVVLGANVVHATADLRISLGNLRQLLAPGGILLLVEITRRVPWFDLIFGLLEGWWRFADLDLRPSHALLGQDEWPRVLEEAGFEDVATLSDPPREGGTMESVLLARAPYVQRTEAEARRWLLLADRGGVSTRLADAIRARGDRCMEALIGPAFIRHTDDLFEITARREDVARLIRTLNDEGPLHAVVHLWSIDRVATDATTTDEMMAWQEEGCLGMLHLIQALEGNQRPLDIWAVTAGAQSIDEDYSGGIAASSLWGLGRVLRNEQPELRPRMIDLGAAPTPDEIEALVSDLYAGRVAEEVALRRQRRFVRRLRPAGRRIANPDGRTVEVAPKDTSFRLDLGTAGALDTLGLRETASPAPAPGQVVIRVLAAGLNFRDVMLALDMLPPSIVEGGNEAGTHSIECAGIVVACGEGIEAYRPGDPVIALAVGALGSHAIAREELVVAKPGHLSFEEAASIPGIYLTAQYGLESLARIGAGERVLIHSASGGVGHAALQLCRLVGAEVYATAGTSEKRDYLRTLGLEHVMDSRSLSWANEIKESTRGEGVDVVLNSLSGEAIARGLQILRPFGRFVEIGKRDIYEDALVGLLPFRKNLAFYSVDLVRLCDERPAVAGAMLREVVARVADGTYALPPRTEFDVSDAEQAYRFMAKAKHVGKVVLTLGRGAYVVRAADDRPHFRPDATYLITGGLGGFGLAISEWMVRQGARHLVLMSRSGTPTDNAQALRALEASDARVRIVRGDVASTKDVARVLAEIDASMPPLRGVLHLAMVLDDALLGQLDETRFQRVLRPKIAGAWNLHRLTMDHPLEHFILFSSISSVVGHPLQGNYAAANTFLDALASYRRTCGRPGISISWGTVAEVGYVARHDEIEQHLNRLGIRSFSRSEALEAFDLALRRDQPHVVAARLDWSVLQKWNHADAAASEGGLEHALRRSDSGSGGADAGDLRGRLRDAAPTERLAQVEALVLKRVSRVMEKSTEQIDPERPLTEMGLDSLLAVELLTALKLDLGVQLPVVKILNGVSVREVAALVLEDLGLSDHEHLDRKPRPRPSPSGDGADVSFGGVEVSTSAPVDAGLSFEQRRFLFLEQFEPGNPALHLFAGARLRGPLDRTVLERAFEEVIRRHEVLRARFAVDGGEPRQEFVPAMPFKLPTVDLHSLPAEERESAFLRLATAAIRKPFDLSKPPLLRALLLHVDATHHALVLMVHHIAADAWAMTVLVRELMAAYDALIRNLPIPLAQPVTRYGDYARWQSESVDPDTTARQLAYWRRQLDGVADSAAIPTDRPRPAASAFRGRRLPWELSAQLSEALLALSRAEGVTLFTTLVGTFQTLLHRHFGLSDVSLGTPVAMRNRPETADLVGCCMNTVVLRADLAGNPTFQDLLRRTREVTLGAFEHVDVPFERVVQELRPPRGERRTPLFHAMLILHNLHWPELSMEGLTVEPLLVDAEAAVCDLTLIVQTGDRLHGVLEYDSDLFEDATAEALLAHLLVLMEAIVLDPGQCLSDLPLLSVEERRHLVVEWNQTTINFGAPQCLHHLFESQAARTPESVAVAGPAAQLTYAALAEQATALSVRLRTLGVGPDVIVGVYSDPSPEMLIGLLGILRAGGAFLLLDPAFPSERVAFMLADAAVSVVLTHSRLAETLPDADFHTVLLDSPFADGPEPDRSTGSAVAVAPENLAYVIYTSGSTGEPKGVMITHAAICNQLLARQHTFPLAEEDVVLQSTALAFDPSVWELFGPIACGARLFIPDPLEDRTPTSLSRMIATHGVTVLQIVPSLLFLLLEEPEIEPCRGMRHVFCGGEPLPGRLRDRFFERLPNVALHNLYGPAEAAIDATWWSCRADETTDFVPIGSPIPNVRAYVLDEHLQPVGVGMTGELYIGGAGLARGYVNRPDLTTQRFVRNPFDESTGARLYGTGDLVRRLPDGALVYVRRIDHQIKNHGVRIEPGEIETVLAKHPDVHEALVVAQQDVPGGSRLVAYVIPHSGSEVHADELRAWCGRSLPSHMVPAYIKVESDLPRLPSGKVDRRALASAPLAAARTNDHIHVAPRDELEARLARIWESLLATEPIGVTDNFFDVGGHSLLAMQLMARIEAEFDTELHVSSLVGSGTVEHLGNLIRKQQSADSHHPRLHLREM